MRLVFLPGGPGFSAAREAQLLAPPLAAQGVQSEFWEDPFRRCGLSVAAGWAKYVDAMERELRLAAGEDLTIAAHSFAVHPLMAILHRGGIEARRVLLIAPAFDLHDSHRRLALLAARDFEELRPTEAARIHVLLGQSTTLFDEPMRQALTIASRDPVLLRHYWHDPHAFAAFAAATEAPDARFSPSTFFGVLSDLAESGLSYLTHDRQLDFAVTVLCGGRDPIVDFTAVDRLARQVFCRVSSQLSAGSGHWPHLEEPKAFVELVVS